MRPLPSTLALLLCTACIAPNPETGQPGGLSTSLASGYLLDVAAKVQRYDTNLDGRLTEREVAGLITEMTSDLAAQLVAGGAGVAPAAAEPDAAPMPATAELSFEGGIPVAAMSALLNQLALDVVSVDVNPLDGMLNNAELGALFIKIGGRIVAAAVAG